MTAAARAPGPVARFTAAQRWVHWTTTAAFVVCLLTAVPLYVAPVALLVGRRALLETVHIYAGLCLPVPALLGWLSAAYRDDMRALNRFQPGDWRWLADARARRGAPPGKFNAGQKLAAAAIGAAIVVLLGTGLIMWRPVLLPVSARAGASLVHDVTAYAFVILVTGHVWLALRDREALRAMTPRPGRTWRYRRSRASGAARH